MLLFLYTGAVVYWMFIGFGRTIHTDGGLQYNLEPLRTVKLYFDLDNGVPFTGRLVNLLGNVAVFVPFGILLPLVNARLNSIILLTGYTVLYILILETMQMLLRVGSFDIDDLLLNMLGVWTGYVLLRLKKRR
ncbi:VanZ family protein [Paenibacillus sp. PK3_47]|nr:VanZ family protein [Paenibacillus sp. PK3_47]